jgi:hypothetical protein
VPHLIISIKFDNGQKPHLCLKTPLHHEKFAGSRVSSAARPPACCTLDAKLPVRGIEVDAVTGDLRVLVGNSDVPAPSKDAGDAK